MTTTELPLSGTKQKSKAADSTFTRVGRFVAGRLLMLFVTIVIGVYLTILIANMGGYVDTIMRNDIRERVNMRVAALTASQQLSPEARTKMVQDMVRLEEKRLGLDTPFAVRSFRYLGNALTLNLGRAQNMVSDNGSRLVNNIILERLPATLLLMGTSNLFLFFFSVFIALILSCLHTALVARDPLGRYLAIGVAMILFTHVFINIGMVTGLLPVVGVTLPLMSYGGSSVLTVFVGLGLLMHVGMRRHLF